MSCSRKIKNGELLELIAWGRAELLRVGIEEAQEECERAMIKFLGCSRSAIYLEEHALEAPGVRESFLKLVEQRVRRIPLAYLLKEADFWKEALFVDERCLIPRPETEILVEQALKALGRKTAEPFSFLDIGTGSGAIAIAILRACPQATGTLLDISEGALEVAGINLEKYGLKSPAKGGATKRSFCKNEVASSLDRTDKELKEMTDRARLVSGDLFGPFSKDEKWDLIVSNPPYLAAEDWIGVQEELKFEPRGALDGGKDGLDFYRKIIAGAKAHLAPSGLLALEVGLGQAEMVSKWLHDAGYDNIQRFNDHLQVERVVMAQRHS